MVTLHDHFGLDNPGNVLRLGVRHTPTTVDEAKRKQQSEAMALALVAMLNEEAERCADPFAVARTHAQRDLREAVKDIPPGMVRVMPKDGGKPRLVQDDDGA